ncbi:hypothetical protein K438DRAFT_1755825 [Mycena galopus ATCC 62051]|nr:hypothetical protein K438DRAFT_1755825 [Mycena galopus ATCC 62051]
MAPRAAPSPAKAEVSEFSARLNVVASAPVDKFNGVPLGAYPVSTPYYHGRAEAQGGSDATYVQPGCKLVLAKDKSAEFLDARQPHGTHPQQERFPDNERGSLGIGRDSARPLGTTGHFRLVQYTNILKHSKGENYVERAMQEKTREILYEQPTVASEKKGIVLAGKRKGVIVAKLKERSVQSGCRDSVKGCVEVMRGNVVGRGGRAYHLRKSHEHLVESGGANIAKKYSKVEGTIVRR